MILDFSRLQAVLADARVARLLATLDGDGEETRVVGGAVRNALVGRAVHEVDLTTTATPDVTRARAEAAGFKVVPTGLAHGTLTIVVAGEPYEVTSLREDVETDGRRAVVRFGRDFAADALRRDFTVNALSVDARGEIHDYAGGLDDLSAGRVRFIGDARRRIREDYLRILRFFRFTADFAQGPVDAAGLDAAIRERAGLAILSRERVRAEMLRLVAARRAGEIVRLLGETGIAEGLIGAAGEGGRLDRAIAADRAPIARLAAFCVRVREDAERLRDRLRLSNEETKRVLAFAALLERLHGAAGHLGEGEIRALVADHPPVAVGDALAALAGEPRPVVATEAGAALAAFEADPGSVPTLPLRGADLVKAGVPKGPAVSLGLAAARRTWLAAGCPADPASRAALLREALAAARAAD